MPGPHLPGHGRSAGSSGSPGQLAGLDGLDQQRKLCGQTFGQSDGKASMMNELDMILDIPVQITVELGRTKITIKNLLQLAHGSVVELDAMAGEPMDVMVNGTLIAQGEVVVVNDKFGIRLTDIITPSERMRKINR